MHPLFAFGLSPGAIVVILIVGVLLFGRRLPEVGKMLGKGIVEFKKGLKGLEDDLDVSTPTQRYEPTPLEAPRPPQRVTAQAPKFEDNGGAVQTPPQA